MASTIVALKMRVDSLGSENGRLRYTNKNVLQRSPLLQNNLSEAKKSLVGDVPIVLVGIAVKFEGTILKWCGTEVLGLAPIEKAHWTNLNKPLWDRGGERREVPE